ncbi:hypothetical protein D3C75_437350 [compost metagenome]
MSQQILNDFHAACRAKLREAVTKFGCTFDPEKVAITLNVRGGFAGWAHHNRETGVYKMRFNEEAILKYNHQMTTDTIPHEVAHLVCYNLPHLGKGHDDGWKRVCRMLGGDDSRLHDMVLTPAKVVNKFLYRLPSGREIELGPKYHANIQSGRKDYFMRGPREPIRKMDWVDFYKQPVQKAAEAPRLPGLNIVKSDIPALPVHGSKREKAEAIYKANRGLARKDLIALFVTHADMTPAGAATYYQTFKSKGI